jgi:hypothetical protein
VESRAPTTVEPQSDAGASLPEARPEQPSTPARAALDAAVIGAPPVSVAPISDAGSDADAALDAAIAVHKLDPGAGP